MPDLTITISDDDLTQLHARGAELGLTPQRFAQIIVHRSLSNSLAKRDLENLADRGRRQREILKLLDTRQTTGPKGTPTLTMKERRHLAHKHGVAVRTISRDLDAVIPALVTPEAVAS